MAIELASPGEQSPDVDEDSFHEEGLADGQEGTEYNFRELFDEVAKLRDIIVTIPTDQIPLLKHGLIVRKSRDGVKLKNAGLIPDSDVLAFLDYPAKDKAGKERPGISDVRIQLRAKKTVTILDIKIPDDL